MKSSTPIETDCFAGAYRTQLLRTLPRILSQLDRDPDSPTYGSFDRDFWHYRMRDFSSMVLQQGMLVLDSLHDFDHSDNPLYQHSLVPLWVDASLNFWASQQLSDGSFNEYYPFEAGYPPTAFTLYAVALVFRKRGFPSPDLPIKDAIQKTCDWLLDHPEQRALNQESAGLAALSIAARIPGIKVDSARLEVRMTDFFNSQSTEGWFPEYGGADLGYLSVTLDSLWDYYETTGEQRALIAMERAMLYLSNFISSSGNTPVMTNSRNTDYIVPYGLIRMAAANPLAAKIVRCLYRRVDKSSHFLSATDDRYLCHYVGQSCFRGMQHISAMTDNDSMLPSEVGGASYFAEAGIYIRHRLDGKSIFIAGKKGGVVSCYNSGGCLAADYGWRWLCGEKKVAVSHWQGGSEIVHHAISEVEDNLVVEGRGSLHKWHISTPFRHLLLRLAAFFSGNTLISRLKDAMIFRSPDAGVGYRREITIAAAELVIKDTFTGSKLEQIHPEPAPCYSLRHVASAGNYSAEELLPHVIPHKIAAGASCLKYETRISLKL